MVQPSSKFGCRLLNNLVLAVVVVALCGSPTGAQEPTEPGPTPPTEAEDKPPEPAKSPEPLAVAPAEIAPRAEQSASRLQDIVKLAESNDELTNIKAELPDTQARAAELELELEAVLGRPSQRSLDASRVSFLSQRTKVDQWQVLLKARSEALQAATNEVNTLEAVWKKTQATDVPDALRERIQAILDQLSSTSAELQGSLDTTLTLQNSVSELGIRVGNALTRIDEAEKQVQKNIFVRDSEPLWRPFLETDVSEPLEENTRRYYEHVFSTLRDFLAGNRQRVGVHIAIFLFFLILTFLLGRFVPPDARDLDVVYRSLIIARRPLSSALLIGLLLTPTVYVNIPPAVSEIMRLAVLIPVLRLLPVILPSIGRVPAAIVAGVYVLQKLELLAVEGELLDRLLLLAGTVLALGGLLWGLLRRQPGSSLPAWRRLLRLIGLLSVIGLAMSVLANVYGAVSLSRLLTNGIFNSAWGIVVLWVGGTVLLAIIVLGMHTRFGRSSRAVRGHAELIQRRVVSALRWLLAVLWVYYVLKWFGIRGAVLNWLRSVLDYTWEVGSLSISPGGIIAFIVAIWLTLIVSRLVRFFLEEEMLPRMVLPRGVPVAISTLAKYTIVAFGLVIAFAAAGVELSSLTLLGGALGVGIGFGLQNVVSNFISGLILVFERPIQVGDSIQFGSTNGIVKRIGIRSSTVRTWQGAEVIVPNANLISAEVINWTLSDRRRRIDLLVPVSRGADPRKVEALLERVAGEQEAALEDPAPLALVQEFGENGMIFELRTWISDPSVLLTLRNELALAINEALEHAGYEIQRAQREIFLHPMSTLPADSAPVAERSME